jgi:hypothetical protein
MIELALYAILGWFIAAIVVIIDLRALRSELEKQRAERAADEKRRRVAELTQARIAFDRHIELVGILLANIVPERPSSAAASPPPTPPQDQDGTAGPETQREPAATRSQRPPAPAFSFSDGGLELSPEPGEEITPARG